jgi:hypothetical protein
MGGIGSRRVKDRAGRMVAPMLRLTWASLRKQRDPRFNTWISDAYR